MPSANVYDMDGKVVREEELDSYVFGAPVNTALLHQVVTAQLVNRRQGTANTKTRSEVSGGNKKPYRQKGTGHARQGSTRAPHYRGGGTVFGPQSHAYERAIPRKMKRIAIRAALSDKAANGRILLMDALTFEEPRTRLMEELLAGLPLERHVLLLLPERDENVILSSRNIHRVKLGNVASINVVELLKYDHLLLPVASVGKIVDAFGAEADDRLQMKRHPNVVARRQQRRAELAAKTAAAAETPAKRGKTATAEATETTSEAKSEDGGAKRRRSRSQEE
ncbi:MAG TPA: 50S ribosomal protein L4 [Ktedonobacterales bacterium]|nr:50S ribosomal protein L4 [Ktedonobacterales bacterium]